jgi:hypothetical protein
MQRISAWVLSLGVVVLGDALGPYQDLADWNTPPWESGVEEGRVQIIGANDG